MSRLSRRGLLAATWVTPALAQEAPRNAAGLNLVLAGESSRLGLTVVDDLLLEQGIQLPLGSLRHEIVPWIAENMRQELQAGHPRLDAVLTNAAGFALGVTRDLWQALPAPLLDATTPLLTPAGQMVQANVGISGLVVGTIPGGPVLLHRRSVLPRAPRSAAELLDYTRENPRRFQYARPGQSRFGQAFVTATPFLLRDRAPLDPQNGWTRSWDYLLELGRHAAYYPSSGQAAAEEFLEGGVDLTPALLGAYLLGMGTGLLPPDTLCTPFHDAPMVPNSLILAVPREVPPERMALLGALAGFLLQPEMQRQAFGRGLLPGSPAANGAAAAQPAGDGRLWTAALTPELAAALAGREVAPPLNPYAHAYMIRAWDGRIGARYGEVQ